jgi:uncharacterized protein (UPF0128 family)
VRRSQQKFRFLLRLADGEPVDPPAFVVAVPDWHEGDTFNVSGRTFRIIEIDADLPDELANEGFNAVWYVERA